MGCVSVLLILWVLKESEHLSCDGCGCGGDGAEI